MQFFYRPRTFKVTRIASAKALQWECAGVFEKQHRESETSREHKRRPGRT